MPNKPSVPRLALAAGLVLLGMAAVGVYRGAAASLPPPVVDVFKGVTWRPEGLLGSRLMVSTKFGRCELHKVRTEKGTVVDDWLWYDETSAVNVLVENEDGAFVVFRQRKYGLERPALATLGGIIEPGEAPLAAARRELREELSLESLSWTDLGSYRTAANRGGGFIHCFLARGATPVRDRGSGADADDDLEERARVRLTRDELAQSLLRREFGEVKWAATAALALLHISETAAAGGSYSSV